MVEYLVAEKADAGLLRIETTELMSEKGTGDLGIDNHKKMLVRNRIIAKN